MWQPGVKAWQRASLGSIKFAIQSMKVWKYERQCVRNTCGNISHFWNMRNTVDILKVYVLKSHKNMEKVNFVDIYIENILKTKNWNICWEFWVFKFLAFISHRFSLLLVRWGIEEKSIFHLKFSVWTNFLTCLGHLKWFSKTTFYNFYQRHFRKNNGWITTKLLAIYSASE